MPTPEAKFREMEKILDDATRDALPSLERLGVQSTDRSLRQHQRGDYLLWQYDFEKSWELDLETARVRVSVSLGEPVSVLNSPQVQIWRCAEQFRPGQISHIRETSEAALSLNAVSDSQLAEVVLNEMRKGAHVLHQAL